MSGASGQVLPGPRCSASPAMRAVVRHLRTYQEGDLQEYCLLLAPESNITGVPAIGESLTSSLSFGSGNPWYCSVSSFQEELRCQPGSEGRYLASSHHLHTPLPQGLVSQVSRHPPLGSCGGGSGHGITCPLAPEYFT